MNFLTAFGINKSRLTILIMIGLIVQGLLVYRTFPSVKTRQLPSEMRLSRSSSLVWHQTGWKTSLLSRLNARRVKSVKLRISTRLLQPEVLSLRLMFMTMFQKPTWRMCSRTFETGWMTSRMIYLMEPRGHL